MAMKWATRSSFKTLTRQAKLAGQRGDLEELGEIGLALTNLQRMVDITISQAIAVQDMEATAESIRWKGNK